MVKLNQLNDILSLKIKKVCLVEIGITPNLDSDVDIVYNEGINGTIVIDGKSYHFLKSKIIKNP